MIGRWGTVDRFAEKYTNITGYQYGANNPISNIDVNGDSIRVSYLSMVNGQTQRNSLYWGSDKQGNFSFYDQSGSQYQGNDAFVGQVAQGLTDLMSGKVGNGLVTDLVGRKDNVEIALSKGDNSAGSDGSYALWNPTNTGAVGNQRPSFIGLGHELAYIQDKWNGTLNSKDWFTYNKPDGSTGSVPRSEIYSTHMENRIRAEHSLSLRYNYAFDPAGKPAGPNILFPGTRASRYYDSRGIINPNYKPINQKKQAPIYLLAL